MTTTHESISAAFDLQAPCDVDTTALHAYWRGKCRGRAMPARADIDPAEIKPLLPYVMLFDAATAERGARIRLLGEAIVQFAGRNRTGEPASAGLQPAAAAAFGHILDSVAAGRPRFRAGKAWWWRERHYCDFEACFLPLSPDGRHVDIILGAAKFSI